MDRPIAERKITGGTNRWKVFEVAGTEHGAIRFDLSPADEGFPGHALDPVWQRLEQAAWTWSSLAMHPPEALERRKRHHWRLAGEWSRGTLVMPDNVRKLRMEAEVEFDDDWAAVSGTLRVFAELREPA
jgi:hypothetical protein